jgi:hypothetical protein
MQHEDDIHTYIYNTYIHTTYMHSYVHTYMHSSYMQHKCAETGSALTVRLQRLNRMHAWMNEDRTAGGGR